jgi:hypothetical protein
MTSQMTQPHAKAALPKGRGKGPGGRRPGLLTPAGRCPLPSCGTPIDPTRLMCRHHWNLIPQQIRDRVWATWHSGQAAASQEHQNAVSQAITACRIARPGLVPVPQPASA